MANLKKITKKLLLTTNAAAASSTGIARARVGIPSSRLFIGIYLVFEPTTQGDVSSYGANTMDAYGFVRSDLGALLKATANPFNNDGVGAQALPDGIEGSFTFDEVQLVHNFAGITPAGKWYVVVNAEPAPNTNICDEELQSLYTDLSLRLETAGAAT